MEKCRFCQWFIDNNFQQDYKIGNFGGAMKAEKEEIDFRINYCPICGKNLKELIHD